MIKVYIDFDGVILDTDKKVSEKISNLEITHKEYIRTCNWNDLLNESEVINNSLEYMKNTKLDINLLSKIGTLD